MLDQTQVSSVTQIKTKIKVVFLGEQSTGKTSILMRFIHDKFEQGLGATVGIDFMAKNMNVGLYSLRLQLWDTAGQQRFRSLIPSYLKDATITFIVFDVCSNILFNQDIRSFENLTEWFQLCAQNKKQKSVVILLGNKSDLTERQVTTEQAAQKAQHYNVKYYEVSAKTGHNICNVFKYAGNQYVSMNLKQNQMTFSQSLGTKDLRTVKETAEYNQNIAKSIVISKQTEKQNKKKKKGCC